MSSERHRECDATQNSNSCPQISHEHFFHVDQTITVMSFTSKLSNESTEANNLTETVSLQSFMKFKSQVSLSYQLYDEKTWYHFMSHCLCHVYTIHVAYVDSTAQCTIHSLCNITGSVSLCCYSNLYKVIVSWHHCRLIKTIGSSYTSETTQTSFSIFSR